MGKKEKFRQRIKVIEGSALAIASCEIRRQVKKGPYLKCLLLEAVKNYIKKKELNQKIIENTGDKNRLYNEEDLKEAFYMGEKHVATEKKVYPQSSDFETWFKQFKNKMALKNIIEKDLEAEEQWPTRLLIGYQNFNLVNGV